MGAALLIARSRLRRNLNATVLLMVLGGLGAGIVMASIAGIRRADASWLRLQQENPPGDAIVGFGGPSGEPLSTPTYDLDEEFERVRDLDGIAVASRAAAAVGVLETADGSRRFPVAANVYIDAPHPALVGRPIMVEGSMPDPDAPDEVAIDELMAERLGVSVGDRVPFTPFTYAELDAASDGRDVDPDGQTAEVLVRGIVRHPGDLLPPRTDQYALYSDEPYLLLTPGWWEANGPDVGNYAIFVVADLVDGADFAGFQEQVAAELGDSAFAFPAADQVGVPEEVKRAVDRQIGAEGRAVAAFAAAVALAALGLLGMALSRQQAVEGADRQTLRALGLTSRGLMRASFLRSLVISVGAGVVAAVVCIGLSAWLPVGVGRRTLRDPGLDIDLAVVAAGVTVVIATVSSLFVLLSARSAWTRPSRSRRLTLADRLARSGASPSATVGVRFALDRAPAGAAGRMAVVAVGVAVAVVVAASGVIGSLDSLRSSPARLGQVWDASAGNFASPGAVEEGVRTMVAIDGVEAVAGELSTSGQVEEREVSLVSSMPYEGVMEPTILDGRPVADEGEVVLGPKLARDLDVSVGETIPVSLAFSDRAAPLEVVGIGPVGAMGFDTDPGESAFVHPSLVSSDEDSTVSVLLVRFAEDADRSATLAAIRVAFPSTVLVAPVPSRSVQTLTGMTVLPVALALTVLLLALVAGANGAVASVRRRGRDLAVLKVLGMRRPQVRGVLWWQSLAWAVIGVVVGVPLGILLASVGWREVLRSLGLESPLTMPVPAMAAVVAMAPLALLALAWWPARRAAATPPAVTLRAE